MASKRLRTISIVIVFSMVALTAWPLMSHNGCDPVIVTGVLLGITAIGAIALIASSILEEKVTDKDGRPLFDRYRHRMKFKVLFIAVMLAVIIILTAISLTIGQIYVESWDVYSLVWGHLKGTQFEPGSDEWVADISIWKVTMPRTVGALIAGAGLAVGGAAMQNVMRNPLADPYTTGISSGAVLGVSVAMILGLTVAGNGGMGIVINAFVFSLIPAFALIGMTRAVKGTLFGTAMSYIFSAMTTILMLFSTIENMSGVFKWQVGTLVGMTWGNVPVMFTVTLVGSVSLYLMSNKLNILLAGDNDAKSFGLNVDNFRTACLLLLSLMTASIISFTGIIGFLGLLTPHIVRLVIGSDSRLVIPASAAFGAMLLLMADIISQTITDLPMPVGVVMSFIGAPMFLIMVLSQKKEVLE